MTRARDLGIPFEGQPGEWNAITDVEDVTVGHTTLIFGEGRLQPGIGPIRTGVTTVIPRGRSFDAVFAGWYSLNGNGEMTGTTWVEESGFMRGPVLITNTHSVGIVRDTAVEWLIKLEKEHPQLGQSPFQLPVAAETFDGFLNDINGFHVKREHVLNALDTAKSGPVDEGCVGGGTGMICHRFKGGIGTSSRIVHIGEDTFTLGVLVQANYGSRDHLTIAGVPVGKEIPDLMPEHYDLPAIIPDGSIIVVVATDAPLLPHQLKRIARRVPMGIAKMGGFGANSSGDIFLAFSTANPGAASISGAQNLCMLANDQMDPLLIATVQATEESIVNAMVAARTMTGINGNTVYALPHERVRGILKKYGRLAR